MQDCKACVSTRGRGKGDEGCGHLPQQRARAPCIGYLSRRICRTLLWTFSLPIIHSQIQIPLCPPDLPTAIPVTQCRCRTRPAKSSSLRLPAVSNEDIEGQRHRCPLSNSGATTSLEPRSAPAIAFLYSSLPIARPEKGEGVAGSLVAGGLWPWRLKRRRCSR
jgi:hypothetical protein